jgi:phage terminase Nu1 subunit (DNA packaging protein)
MRKIPTEIVDAKTLARHCRLSERRIRQLTQVGLPKVARNRFDLVASISWYIRFLQTALENKGAEVGDGTLELFRSQKARALNVTAQLKELELKKRRAEFVTVAEARDALADFARIVRARFSTVPIQLAAQCVNQPSRTMLQAIVEKHLNEAMSLLASVDRATVSEMRRK